MKMAVEPCFKALLQYLPLETKGRHEIPQTV
jgi:hypothetical protein